MQLTPRYGDTPIITLDGDPAAIATPALRQRRRLLDAVTAFGADEWAHPTRCAGWSVRDVIVHLDTTNTFWCYSITCGLKGEPTRFLANFDPVASPAQLVADAADVTFGEVLERFTASTQAMEALVGSLDEQGWETLAEAPPGHLSVSAVMHHALWDSWVHERDILLPMGTTAEHEVDEVSACLRYALALSPAFALSMGSATTGTLAVAANGPQLAAVAEITDHVAVRSGGGAAELTLTGDAVALVEALSVRGALEQPVPAGTEWMFQGLLDVFDSA